MFVCMNRCTEERADVGHGAADLCLRAGGDQHGSALVKKPPPRHRGRRNGFQRMLKSHCWAFSRAKPKRQLETSAGQGAAVLPSAWLQTGFDFVVCLLTALLGQV